MLILSPMKCTQNFTLFSNELNIVTIALSFKVESMILEFFITEVFWIPKVTKFVPFAFLLWYEWETLLLTRSLREPGGPCTKSMEVSESRTVRAEIFAVVYFREFRESNPRENFHFNLCLFIVMTTSAKSRN